jgi:hypothetical protein
VILRGGDTAPNLNIKLLPCDRATPPSMRAYHGGSGSVCATQFPTSGRKSPLRVAHRLDDGRRSDAEQRSPNGTPDSTEKSESSQKASRNSCHSWNRSESALLVQAPQIVAEMADWAHSEMLMPARPGRTFRYACRRADCVAAQSAAALLPGVSAGHRTIVAISACSREFAASGVGEPVGGRRRQSCASQESDMRGP